MTGVYQTLDGCEYELFYEKIGKPVKVELMARCVKSTVRSGPFTAFVMKEENIKRNLRHGLWSAKN